jgi:hypothetical protein
MGWASEVTQEGTPTPAPVRTDLLAAEDVLREAGTEAAKLAPRLALSSQARVLYAA